jgi:hypothetical protein
MLACACCLPARLRDELSGSEGRMPGRDGHGFTPRVRTRRPAHPAFSRSCRLHGVDVGPDGGRIRRCRPAVPPPRDGRVYGGIRSESEERLGHPAAPVERVGALGTLRHTSAARSGKPRFTAPDWTRRPTRPDDLCTEMWLTGVFRGRRDDQRTPAAARCPASGRGPIGSTSGPRTARPSTRCLSRVRRNVLPRVITCRTGLGVWRARSGAKVPPKLQPTRVIGQP